MRERADPAETWRPRRSFTNTDSSAVKLAEILHGARQPHLTILFGSRATHPTTGSQHAPQ